MTGQKLLASRSSFWLTIGALLCVVSLWQVISSLPTASRRIIPSPLQVVSSLVEMILDGRLLGDASSSIARAVVGFALGSTAAVLCGVLTGRNLVLRNSLGQIIHLLRPVPAISIVPLAIIWFGLGEESKVFTVFWGVFFPVWVNTHVGVSSVNIEYIWVAQSLGATRRAVLLEVILPGSATAILAGMRTGISIAFICLVAAEMAGASTGLGFRISISHLTFRVDQMIAAIAVLGMLGALADKLFVKATHKLFPWYARSQRAYQGD